MGTLSVKIKMRKQCMLQHLEIEAVYNCQSTNKKVAEIQRLFYLLQVLGGKHSCLLDANRFLLFQFS